MTPEDRKRGEKLRALAEQLKGKPVAWGVDDCSTMPAQWVADITGREFDWPAYSSREKAAAIIEAEGGLVAIWDKVARRIGVEELWDEPPRVGDVGIIETRGGPVGGIFLFGGIIMWRAEVGTRQIGVVGRSFPVRADDGWVQTPVIKKVWRV